MRVTVHETGIVFLDLVKWTQQQGAVCENYIRDFRSVLFDDEKMNELNLNNCLHSISDYWLGLDKYFRIGIVHPLFTKLPIITQKFLNFI